MKSIDSVVDEFVKKNYIEDKYILSKIRSIWREKFPQIINSNVNVIDFKNSILEFHTTSSSWRKEVKLRRNDIIKKINTELQGDFVDDIKI